MSYDEFDKSLITDDWLVNLIWFDLSICQSHSHDQANTEHETLNCKFNPNSMEMGQEISGNSLQIDHFGFALILWYCRWLLPGG